MGGIPQSDGSLTMCRDKWERSSIERLLFAIPMRISKLKGRFCNKFGDLYFSLILRKASFEGSPEVLYRVKVRAVGGPGEGTDVLRLEPSCGLLAGVLGFFVLLNDDVLLVRRVRHEN